jgi:integrase
MAKIRFTAGRVTSFQCPPDKQQAFLWDSEAPGLGLRATAGAKAYIFQAKLLGKVIRTTIGGPGTWALEEARDSKTGLIVTPGARQEARRLKALTDLGRDPRQIKADATAADAAQRRKTKEEKTPALEAWNDYVTVRTGKWSKRHQADHESMAREGGEPITRGRRPNMPATKEPGILRPLLLLPLADITRDRVATWLEEEGPKRPTRTRLALSLLATFLNWCADRPAYRDQVVADACVRMKRELPKPKAKDDCLQREQLPLWFDAVRELSNPVVRAYLQCLLLVGCRREELAGLQWEDINFQWKSLTIRDKVEGTRTIPLTPYVATLLLELKRLRDAPPKVRALRGPDPQGEKRRHLLGYLAAVLRRRGGLPNRVSRITELLRRRACLICPYTDCVGPSARWRSGLSAQRESQLKSWGTSQARPPKSTIAAARWIFCGYGTPRLRAGFCSRRAWN